MVFVSQVCKEIVGMRGDIQEKLQGELKKEIKEESQVVYILSRIRKLLEIDKKLDKYNILKFYCDWSLHNEIDRHQTLLTELLGDMPDGEKTNGLLTFEIFRRELEFFIEEYKLETYIYKNAENESNFKKLLVSIYSEVPLIIKSKKKQIITLKTGDFSGNMSSVKFTYKEE